MRELILITLCVFSCTANRAQKPRVNFDTYKTWSHAVGGQLSADSRHMMYTETNVPARKNTLHLKTTDGREIFTMAGLSMASFTRDSKYLIGKVGNDSVLLYNIGFNHKRYLTGIQSFNLSAWANTERLLTTSKNGRLQVSDFSGKTLWSKDSVAGYVLNESGSNLVYWIAGGNAKAADVYCYDTKVGKSQMIYHANAPSNVIFDQSGNQLAFTDNTVDGKQIIYYKKGMEAAIPLEINNKNITTGEYWSFSKDGNRIFFSIVAPPAQTLRQEDKGIQVLSYQDRYLAFKKSGGVELTDQIPERQYLNIIDLRSKRVLQLLNRNQRLVELTLNSNTDNYCIVEELGTLRSDSWNDGFARSYYLCNTLNGELTSLEKEKIHPIHHWNISPGGRYAIYYDVESHNYYCFDVLSKTKTNISEKITDGLDHYESKHYSSLYRIPLGLAGWLKNDQSVLIRGTYDLWMVDPTAKVNPVNITLGKGTSEKVIFNTAENMSNDWISSNDQLLLMGFDTKSKDVRFYRKSIAGKGLNLISTNKMYISDPYSGLPLSDLQKTSNGHLIRIETADKSSNYYFSKDLHSFKAMSDVGPERKWNWLTSELHTYKDSLGTELQGILYKPQNFDSSRKYPVIFIVYEFFSNQLNANPSPGLWGAGVMPPMMVSNGYLIFYPDVRSAPKYGSEAVTRSVIAAADHLSKYNWVDVNNVGIVGHSVGGWVVNSVVTQTNRFKAAVSGAGISDMISSANEVQSSGRSKQEFLKSAVYMMEANLGEDPDVYVRNSPILKSSAVKSPILLVHNDKDGAVSYTHSRSFFLTLRSLQKPCWWLNYQGQDHIVMGNEQRIDYNTRVKGFFDHYLKGSGMPEWMNEHIR